VLIYFQPIEIDGWHPPMQCQSTDSDGLFIVHGQYDIVVDTYYLWFK